MKELYIFSIQDSNSIKLQFCEDKTLIEAFAEQNLDEMLPLKEANWISVNKRNYPNACIESFQSQIYPTLHFGIIASPNEAEVTKIKREMWKQHCQYINKFPPIDYFYGYI